MCPRSLKNNFANSKLPLAIKKFISNQKRKTSVWRLYKMFFISFDCVYEYFSWL